MERSVLKGGDISRGLLAFARGAHTREAGKKYKAPDKSVILKTHQEFSVRSTRLCGWICVRSLCRNVSGGTPLGIARHGRERKHDRIKVHRLGGVISPFPLRKLLMDTRGKLQESW